MTRPAGTTEESSERGAATAADAGRPVRAGWRGTGPGGLIVAIAWLALYAGRDLPGLVGGHIGPGAMPDTLSALLLVLGVIIAVEGFFSRRIGEPGSIVPAIALAAAGAAFLLTVGTLGLAASTGLAAAVVAGHGLRTRPVAFVVVVVASIAAAALLALFKLMPDGGA